MTTLLNVSCPETSHWGLKIQKQVRKYDFEKQKNSKHWSNSTEPAIILKPGEVSQSLYIHDSARVVIEEIVLDQ